MKDNNPAIKYKKGKNSIKDVLKRYADETNKVLNDLLIQKNYLLSPTLIESMKYTLFSGGKRLRPILTILVAELIDGDIKNARLVGAAIEMIHTYSLIHDDLPSMDDDAYRRGKPTNHRVYGPGIAILAGDGLLTYAFSTLSRLTLSAEQVVKIIKIISDGAGISGMVGGQVLDLEAENREIDIDEMKKIHRAKTGAMFHSAIMAGAYCGHPTMLELKALKEYASKLGLAFQIVDDILDVVGDEEKMGKKTGSDQKKNKATYPGMLGLKEARQEAEKNNKLAKKALNIFGEKADLLKNLSDFIIIRQS